MKKRKPLTNFQIVCILLLWAILCTLVISGTPQLDGVSILSLAMATVLIFIPIYQSITRRRK